MKAQGHSTPRAHFLLHCAIIRVSPLHSLPWSPPYIDASSLCPNCQTPFYGSSLWIPLIQSLAGSRLSKGFWTLRVLSMTFVPRISSLSWSSPSICIVALDVRPKLPCNFPLFWCTYRLSSTLPVTLPRRWWSAQNQWHHFASQYSHPLYSVIRRMTNDWLIC